MIVLRWLTILLVAFTGGAGLYNGVTEFPDGVNAFQRTVSILVLLYGVLGVVATVAMVRRSPRAPSAVLAWGAAVVTVATLAPLAYAPDDVSVTGAIVGGLVTTGIAAGVWWVTRRYSLRATSSISVDRLDSGRSDQPS